MTIAAFQDVIDAAREELLGDLDPKTRELFDAAQAAYSAEMDRIRENQERLAERYLARADAWRQTWEEALRAVSAEDL